MSAASLRVTLDGDLIFTADPAPRSHLMGWHQVTVDAYCDLEITINRLNEIFSTRGIHFENVAGSRVVNLAPAFKVEIAEVLA